MRITKICHSCLVLEIDGATFIIDPGSFSTAQNDIEGVDAVLITHEHQDHLDVSSVKSILAKNPQAKIYTNAGVGAYLEKEGISFEKMEEGKQVEVKGVPVQFLGTEHAVIYQGFPSVQNSGVLIGEKFFYPGDGFFVPNVPVEVLALPVAAPWMKCADGIDYAKAVAPKICFPVHDGFLDQKHGSVFYRLPESMLKPLGIEFVHLGDGESREL